MHEVYLLPFEMVIRAGIGSLMTSYNQVNGVWTYRHADVIDGLARKQWGFDGIVVSDWCCLYSPLALKGGVSLEMPEGTQYGDKLRVLLSEGGAGVTEEDVDRCVRAYLHTLDRFGMLKAPRRPAPVSEAVKRRNIPVARRLAARGAVLLKNNGVLPLPAGGSFCVIGPTGMACAMPVFREGAYGFADRKHSPLQALEGLVGHKVPCAVGNDLEGVPVPDACLHGLHYTKVRYAPRPDGRPRPSRVAHIARWRLDGHPPPSLCRRSCAAAHTAAGRVLPVYRDARTAGERLAPSLPAVQYP